MASPSAAPGAQTPPPSLAWTCLLLALVLPLGLVLFVLRTVIAMQPTLQPVPVALDLILENGPIVLLLLGIPASSLAIGLGHFTLGRFREVPAGQRARRVARTGLALSYLSFIVLLAAVGFTAFSLATQRMHLVW
jgi:hypothetical protein